MTTTVTHEGVELMKTCSISRLSKLKRENPEGFIAVITQPGCDYCKPMLELAAKTVGKALPVYQIDAGEKGCDTVMDRLNVSETPSVFFFSKGHKSPKAIAKGDKTNDEIREELLKIVAKAEKKRAKRTKKTR